MRVEIKFDYVRSEWDIWVWQDTPLGKKHLNVTAKTLAAALSMLPTDMADQICLWYNIVLPKGIQA